MEVLEFFTNLGLQGGKMLLDEIVQYVQTKQNRINFDQEFLNILTLHNATVYSDQILNFLAKNGYLEITNSYVQASNKLIISAEKMGSFKIGENSRIGTNSSYVTGGKGTSITGTGNARIDFSDGGITFSV